MNTFTKVALGTIAAVTVAIVGIGLLSNWSSFRWVRGRHDTPPGTEPVGRVVPSRPIDHPRSGQELE